MKLKIASLAVLLSTITVHSAWAGQSESAKGEQTQTVASHAVQTMSFQDMLNQATGVDIRTMGSGKGWYPQAGKIRISMNDTIREKLRTGFGSDAAFKDTLKKGETVQRFTSRRKWELMRSRAPRDRFLERWSFQASVKLYAANTETSIDLWYFAGQNELIPVLFFTTADFTNGIKGTSLLRAGEIKSNFWSDYKLFEKPGLIRACALKISGRTQKTEAKKCEGLDQFRSLLNTLEELAPLHYPKPPKGSTPKLSN